MKNCLLPAAIISLSFPGFAGAQPFSTYATMDVNNIAARSMVHGDQWWDPVTSTPKCEYPKGSGKHVGFASALWIGGYDAQANLHVSAQTYRQSGNDFWPGPIDSSGSALSIYATAARWAKIWTVTRGALDSFFMNTTHTLANTPASILDWPARGGQYVKNASGQPLSVVTDRAPFIDVNNNGTYEPLSGDYPFLKGDKMMWWMYNDQSHTHDETVSQPLGIEIEQLAYGYKRQTTIDNAIFYEYLVKNKSTSTYDSTRISFWADLDLGFYNDDLMGYDSSRRMAFIYNGTSNDQVYGTDIPYVGMTFVELPGDSLNYLTPAGGYTTFSNDNGPFGNPQGAVERYALMNNHSRSHTPFIYAPGNLIYNIQDTVPCASITPADRRFVTASNTFAFAPNTATRIAYALVVCPNSGGCPNFNYQGCLPTLADTALWYYRNPQGLTGLAVGDPIPRDGLTLTPNPAKETITLRGSALSERDIVRVYDLTGRQLSVHIASGTSSRLISVQDLPTGMYILRCTVNGVQRSLRFVKD